MLSRYDDKLWDESFFTIRKSVERVAQFETVVWDVFFESKNRGISLLRHFPWLSNDDNLAYYMVAELEGQVIGGLAVRKWVGSAASYQVKIGLIGLVCIAPVFRGRGFATALMNATLKQASYEGFDALTLWTEKSFLYKRYGFVEADIWTYGWAHRNCTSQATAFSSSVSIKLVERPSAPIPPYALSTHELIGAQSLVFLVKDLIGWIVTGYSGNVKEAASAMSRALPRDWRINLERDDMLFDELKRQGYDLDLKPVNLQMWFCINPNYSVTQLVEKLRISVMERI